MKISEAVLWPGTKICERMGVDPTSDGGLIRWFFNTLIYLTLSLIVVWIVVV